MAKPPPSTGRAKPVAASPVAARATLTVRLRSEVRTDVERSAVRYGRSLSEEIESRLEASFALTEYLRREWGEDIFRIAQAAAGSLSFIEDFSGKSWTEDQESFDMLQATMASLIENYRGQVTRKAVMPTPQGQLESKSIEERGRMFAALGGLAPPRPRKPGRDLTSQPHHDGTASMLKEIADTADDSHK